MQIYSMGEGLFDEAVQDMAGKPCVLLMCDSREEFSNALRGITFGDPVTVVRASEPNGADSGGAK